MMYTRLVLSDKSPWWSSNLFLPIPPHYQCRKRGHGKRKERTLVLVEKEMVDARGIETRGATNDAVHHVALFEE